MIAIEKELGCVTFDLIGTASLLDATKAIRKHMKWDLASCIEAARMLLSLKSITLVHTIEIGA